MALGKARYRGRGFDRKLGRRALQGVVAAVLLGLGACNPIEGYRHLTGASKNDPDPATTPNTQNLAAGEKSPYPNLATVPPPPTQALTTAELDKLTQSLIADRKNAKYTSEQLQAGFDEVGGPTPAAPATAGSSRGDRVFRRRGATGGSHWRAKSGNRAFRRWNDAGRSRRRAKGGNRTFRRWNAAGPGSGGERDTSGRSKGAAQDRRAARTRTDGIELAIAADFLAA